MAAENPSRASAPPGIDEEQVRNFLTTNPDFLQRHPELLRSLQVPHASGDAVSLVERQVSVLRERNVDLRHRLKELTEAARENERLYAGTRAVVLALLEATDVDDLLRRFERDMATHFDADYTALIVYDPAAASPAAGTGRARRADPTAVRSALGSIIKGGKPTCGALRAEEFQHLFPGTHGAGSAAIAPVSFAGDHGLIAVGSADAKRYHSQMGTLFLQHLAAVVARLLTALAGGRHAGA